MVAATPAAERSTSATPPFPRVFDWARWPLSRGRLAAAACVLAFAVALAGTGGSARVVAVLLVAETLLLCLPWRLPRTTRSVAGFWTETLCGLIAPLGAVAVAWWTDAAWWGQSADWWWYAAGGALGAALIWASGMNLRALATGELAFLAGPTRPGHGYARATATLVGPAGEEALFRGVVLTTAAGTAAPLGLLAAAAFVARHHVPPGANGRDSTRAMGVEIGSAAALLALTAASQSLYPALLAHLLNNIPPAVLQFQCARSGRPTP
ncbi:type II CAAX prenyl endopeptidase Rce1 family protein [Streptomyces sp. NPDC059851]|uniref:CPBP family glutamic-type intramembrane protease n=1 Tax=Streptomyces sp. NPDC059851 TaxID=3346971 RepID=UPI0036653E32